MRTCHTIYPPRSRQGPFGPWEPSSPPVAEMHFSYYALC
jgi:hypothetical protein